MAVVAIIQARMGSTRLPGKVNCELMGSTVLEHVVRRAKAVEGVELVVVATTDQPKDDILIEVCKKNNFKSFRGSQQDVLERYYQAAREYKASTVVRITSDCPLLDPKIAAKVVSKFIADKCDYCSNILNRSYPIGLDVEVMSFAALERAWNEASSPYEREHVTPYLSGNPNLFTQSEITYQGEPMSLDFAKMRWTLDYPEDLVFIEKVYQHLYSKDPLFGIEDILSLLSEHPELKEINSRVG